MPIRDIQRRMVEVGRIRAGERGDRGQPKKLEHWRLTSKDPRRLEAAAGLWGGKPREWKDHPGEFELYTKTDVLPIMLLPGALPTTWYELWSAGGCQRRCDGQHEIISDNPCICDTEEQERQCKPHTRLAVMLPDVPGIGAWLLQSNGWNAAAELAGVADVLQRATAQGVLLPALLRLEQRHEVKGGQTRRFAVPVIDVGVSMSELLAGQGVALLTGAPAQPALPPPPGGTPIDEEERGGTSVRQALAAVAPPSEAAPRRANAAEPVGAPVAELEVGAGPAVPAEGSDEVSTATAAAAPTGADGAATAAGDAVSSPASSDTEAGAPSPPAEEPQADPDATSASPAAPPPPPQEEPKLATQAQKKLLNTLYGQMREVPMDGDGNVLGNPLITIGGLYAWAAKARNIEVDLMIQLLEGRDEAGKLHWPPLRESLTRAEAAAMIEGMQGIQAKAQEDATEAEVQQQVIEQGEAE